jgi:Gpi18-like mannosyltransferase
MGAIDFAGTLMDETRKTTFARLVILFLVSRLFLEAVGVLAMFYFPPASSVARVRDLKYHKPVSPFFEMWVHWDSEWWLMIAEKGYLTYDVYKDFGGGRYMQQETAKFFPAYPGAIRVASWLTGNSVTAGILVSNLALLLFLRYLFRLGGRLFDEESGFRAGLLYLAFPTGFFLSAVYSEAMFLASLTAAFYYLETKKLLPACLAAGISVLCRSQAFMAAPVLVWLAWQRFPERRWWAACSAALALALPLAGYLLYIHLILGSITWIPETIRYWRGSTLYPLYAFVRFFTHPVAIHGQHNSMIDFSFALLHLVALAVSFRKIPMPYWVYSAIALLFPLSSTLFSFSRLCLANIPFFLYLGRNTRATLDFFAVPFWMLQAFFMAAFAIGYWVA